MLQSVSFSSFLKIGILKSLLFKKSSNNYYKNDLFCFSLFFFKYGNLKGNVLFRMLLRFYYQSCLKFQQLGFLVGIDRPGKKFRFSVTYFLLSYFGTRLSFKLQVFETSVVCSVGSLFLNGGVLERELWDLFGIPFLNNYDLRRLITDYGFKGHPLRKDFPLTGFVEIYYSDVLKSIVEVEVELIQQYRVFTFFEEWGGVEGVVDNLTFSSLMKMIGGGDFKFSIFLEFGAEEEELSEVEQQVWCDVVDVGFILK